MRVRADALLAMLSFAVAPSPIYARPALTRRNAMRFADHPENTKFVQYVLYDLTDGEIYMISDGWSVLIEEYRTQGDMYYKFCQEMTEFVVRIPHRLWFPEKPVKKLLLPPYEDILTGGPLDQGEWADKFST